jgi:TPR repeat protein
MFSHQKAPTKETQMISSRFILSAATALALVSMSNAASASSETWERADREYQVQHYGNALEIYEQIAATGDARAAEVAGHMLILGQTLYGDAVQRDPARAAQWQPQAASAGRPIAMHLLRQVDLAHVASGRNRYAPTARAGSPPTRG